MGSKILKAVKKENSSMKDAVKDQKQQEKDAKKEYQKAKAEAGFFASKEEKLAKLNYEQEKLETKQGEALQKKGKQLEKVVSEGSRTMGIFHSDKQLSADVKKQVSAQSSQVQSFVAQASGKAAKSSSASKAVQDAEKSSSAGDTLANKVSSSLESIAQRALPSIAGLNSGSQKDNSGLSL